MQKRMEENISCPVCCDIFSDPVLLMCSHSFCRACLKQCWDSKTSRECPVCRIEATGAEPPSNLVLKNLCEAFSQETSQRVSASSDSLCSLHGEKLKLFCLDDEEPICIICQTSEKHENHKLRPVQEAALKYKDDLGKALKPLKAKLEEMQKAKQTCDQRAKRITSQSEQGERQMREEFEKLHMFLRDEEKSGIASMKEEEKKKGELVKRKTEALTKDMEALSCSIRSIEQEMRREDITFLQNYKDTKKRAQVTVQVPEEAPSEDMDVSKHLDKLKDRVMEQMLQVFQHLGGPSHWKTTMNSPDNKNMYFIVESSEYTRDHNVGRICYIEESKYVSRIQIDNPTSLEVKIIGLYVEKRVKVNDIQPLSEQEAQLLLALGDDEARLRAFRDREGLDQALRLTKYSRVTVQVDGEWCQGVIRYIGPITRKRYPDPITGTFFGIELQGKDKGKGQHDGQYNSERYFKCSKDCGVFTPFTRVRSGETKL